MTDYDASNNYGQNDNVGGYADAQDGMERARLQLGGGNANPWLAYGYDPSVLDQYGNPIFPGEPLRRLAQAPPSDLQAWLNSQPLNIDGMGYAPGRQAVNLTVGVDGVTPQVAAGYGGAAGTPGANGRMPGSGGSMDTYSSTGYTDASGGFHPYTPNYNPNTGFFDSPTPVPGQQAGGGGGGGGVSGGGGGGGGQGYNPALLSAAQAAANQAYLNARLRELEIPQMQAQTELEKQKFALAKAQEAFQETLAQANLTGYVQNKPTNYAEQAVGNYARNGGNGIAAWQAAVPGLTDQEAAMVNDRMRGLYAQTHASATEEQAKAILRDVTGGRIGSDAVTPPTPTLQREQFETGAAQNYLGLLNQQRGPSNAFAYLKTLQNTPQSIRDIINRATNNVGFGGIAGAAIAGAGLGAGGGEFGAGRMVNGVALPGPDPMPDAGGSALPLGSQINARDWMNSSPYLKKLTLAGYEADQQDPEQVMDDFQKSLPKYGAAVGARYGQ